MRIPILLVLPLAILTIGLIWWWGVREKDFVTPPNAQSLTAVRESALSELEAMECIAGENSSVAIKAKPTKLVLPSEEDTAPTAEPVLPIIDAGDLTIAPGLDSYLSAAAKGPVAMTNLATHLETIGELQRALLAWERLLDATPADPAQQETARKAIERLRPQVPVWNVDPLAAQSIVLNASCDAERAKNLEPLLQEIVQELNAASSGMLNCSLQLKAGAKPSANAPRQPVALWFQGASVDSPSSKTMTIPVLSDSAPEQRKLLIGNVYKLLRDGVNMQPELRPLSEWQPSIDPTPLLQNAITRRTWSLWSRTFTPKNP